ncbi:hypothetical protein FHW96_003187 [Novosphingobium sp. SG751A]|uniref:hypothetical protein n=1 Tax=Novosphingobium sp. SG751A TaxID=2587000 RepID=UPI001554B1E7|nr:hypothetical protein [Novosphingobium sp. SG751A]NOW47016.1 hypothetical protein [Novosphingobium sp. SG751A]
MRKGLGIGPYAAILGALAIGLPQGAQAQMAQSTIEQTIEQNHAESDFAVPDFARPVLAPRQDERPASAAEKLRKLDIMLMVTGLRCRTTADNFLEDFQAFEAAHMSELNAAARDLKIQIAAQEGKDGAERALDRIGVGMANQFGGGHPWLDCRALKELAHALAVTQGTAVLQDAADLALGAGPRLAYRP